MKKILLPVLMLISTFAWAQKERSHIQFGDSTSHILGKPDIQEVTSLKETINSPFQEGFPVLDPGGKKIYFTRKNHPKNKYGIKDQGDIWYSEKKKNTWSEPVNMRQINDIGANYLCQIVPPQKSQPALVIMGNKYDRNKKRKNNHLRATEFTGKWKHFNVLKIGKGEQLVNKTYSFLSHDRTVLLITLTNKRGGYGQSDIYACPATGKNTFGRPVNLGELINTRGSEISPYLSADNKRLYYSSNGIKHDTYGRQDIYVSCKLDDDNWKNWSLPMNMGPVINGEFDDMEFTMGADNDIAYYTKGITNINTDIVTAKIAFKPIEIQVAGHLADPQTGVPLAGRVIAKRVFDGQLMAVADADPATGEYKMRIPSGEQYIIQATVDNTNSKPIPLDLQENTQTEITISEFEGISAAAIRSASAEKYRTNEDEVSTSTEQYVTNRGETYISQDNYPTNPTVGVNTFGQTLDGKTGKPIGQVSVLFGFNRANIADQYRPVLDQLAENLITQPTQRIAVSGYTDMIGSESYNMYLSSQRAYSVASYLLKRGVLLGQMDIFYYGEKNAGELQPESEITDRSKRRVDIGLIETGTLHVTFGFDQEIIDTQYYSLMEYVVKQLQNNPELTINLAGHTDKVGSLSYNMELSMRRANTIATYLMENSIEQERIQVDYYGEGNPLNNANHPLAYRRNRRVEMKIV